MAAHGVGVRGDGSSGFPCQRVGVDPHVGKAVAQPRFHGLASRERQRSTVVRQDLVDDVGSRAGPRPGGKTVQ